MFCLNSTFIWSNCICLCNSVLMIAYVVIANRYKILLVLHRGILLTLWDFLKSHTAESLLLNFISRNINTKNIAVHRAQKKSLTIYYCWTSFETSLYHSWFINSKHSVSKSPRISQLKNLWTSLPVTAAASWWPWKVIVRNITGRDQENHKSKYKLPRG